MLELSSNAIKVLGIFGRLCKEQEEFLDSIEARYSDKPATTDYDIFRHLTLTFIPGATVHDLSEQLELLKELKQFLPLKLKVNRLFIKDEESLPGAEHIAIEFGLEQTKDVIQFIKQRTGDYSVATWYIKVVWFVPKDNQKKAMAELAGLKEMVFDDFYLVSNKQNDENTIYTTKRFGAHQ